MSKLLEFLNGQIDVKIKHYEGRLNSAINGIEDEDVATRLRASGEQITECGIALELLQQFKHLLKQAENFEKLEK